MALSSSASIPNESGTKPTLLTVFGTRPEAIKLMPVLRAMAQSERINRLTVSTGQQSDLLPAFITDFALPIDASLGAMRAGQSLNESLAHMLEALDKILGTHQPDAVLVQGDTSSALAGALAARLRAIPVVHLEAGLRSGNVDSPFPEESYRRVISQLSSLHLAATAGNVEALVREGIREIDIVLTGNPIVDALQMISDEVAPSVAIRSLVEPHCDRNIVILTLHRRENFGERLERYVETVCSFVRRNENTVLIVPVHPNPNVSSVVQRLLCDADRVLLVDPLPYRDFLFLLEACWLVLSDSGGVQEEVISFNKPLLVLRDTTERPEALSTGMVRLARNAADLETELQLVTTPGSWIENFSGCTNPFGDGASGPRIASLIDEFLRSQ